MEDGHGAIGAGKAHSAGGLRRDWSMHAHRTGNQYHPLFFRAPARMALRYDVLRHLRHRLDRAGVLVARGDAGTNPESLPQDTFTDPAAKVPRPPEGATG